MKSSRTWRAARSRPAQVFLSLVSLPLLAAAQEAPVAAFTTDPSPAEGGDSLTVQFLDLSTGDITSWSWDLGDGSTSSEQSPSHTYGIGTFDVALTVTGPAGSDTFTLVHAVDVVETLFGFIGAQPPLSTLPVLLPSNLDAFVADREAAIRLGKALFWDVQAGSDGMTACATCHYHAGVDNRVVNTFHPGADGTFDTLHSGTGGGPNYRPSAGDFPFRKFLFPDTGDELIADTDDRRGAAGVFKTLFEGIDPESAEDLGTSVPDDTFHVGGVNALQATGRDAPSTIGAIFMHRLFWDGRANNVFNGVNIWGDQDPDAAVLEMRPDGTLGEIPARLDNAAAASQAVGPPLSDVEMSWGGRSWPDLGRKLLPRQALARQWVHPEDGVLGPWANPAGDGLVHRPRAAKRMTRVGGAWPLTYAEMVREAFHERWWGSAELADGGFTHMEANFSLFWGLAILMYESTLIPDQTPYDAFAGGDELALSDAAKRGLGIFLGKGKCSDCHGTPMFAGDVTSDVLFHSDPNEGEGILEIMSMGNALAFGGVTLSTSPKQGELALGFNPFQKRVGVFTPGGALLAEAELPAGARCLPEGEQTVELVPTALVTPDMDFSARVVIQTDGACGTRVRLDVQWNELPPAGTYQFAIGAERFGFSMFASNVAVYDNGFYNIGVRPNSEDLGIGGDGPFGPLALTKRKQLLGETFGTPAEEGVSFVGPNDRIAVDGAFKAPTLRNIELTGPYFHHGGAATLEQVVEFYARGTDFGTENADDLDPDVSGFSLVGTDKADLVAFMESLTDPRVRHEMAPFDHPELPLKEGLVGDHTSIVDDGTGKGVPIIEVLPATGASGGPAIPTFAEQLGASLTAHVTDDREDGATMYVFLDKRPQSDVTLELAVSDPLANLEPRVLTFTPENWRKPQRVLTSWPVANQRGVKRIVLERRVDIRVADGDVEYRRLSVAPVVLGTAAATVNEN